MNNILSMRLKRLERSPILADPYAYLTDEQLAVRIEKLDREIEAVTGASCREYAGLLRQKLHYREPLPRGIPEGEARQFVQAHFSFEALDYRGIAHRIPSPISYPLQSGFFVEGLSVELRHSTIGGSL